MKKFLPAFIAFLFSVSSIWAQNHQWAKRISGSGSFSVSVNDVVVNDYVYVGGSFTGTVDFDPGTGTTNKAALGTDGFVAKYDHAGNFIWVYTTNVSNVEVVRSMKATTLLNVAMTTLNNSSLQMIALDFVTGAVYASATYNTSGGLSVNKLDRGPGNVLYIVGAIFGGFTVGNTTLTTVGSADAYLLKFTPGNTPASYFTPTYLKGYGGTLYDEAFDVSVYQSRVRVVGTFEGTIGFPSGGSSVSLTSAGGKDGFVIEVSNSIGLPTSADEKLRIGSAGDESITSIDAYSDTSSFVIGGYFSGTIDFDPTATTVNRTPSGTRDGFVASYRFIPFSSVPRLNFVNSLGGTNEDEVTDVSVGGNVRKSVYYALSNGAASGSAISIGAYDSTGVAVSFGGLLLPSNQTTLNRATSIFTYLPSPAGIPDIYLGGIFNAKTDFNPGGGVDTISPIAGGNNGFISKLSSCSTATAPTIVAKLDSVCLGVSDTLIITAGALNGNANWIWYSGSCGGTQAGTGTQLIVTPGITTNYYARGEAGCASSPGACSLVKQIKLISPPPPVITISTPTTTVCAGSSVTFTASATGLGTNTSYAWKRNGTTFSSSSNPTVSTTALANNDIVTCLATTTNSCGVVVSDTSAGLSMNVLSTVVPVITISAPSTSVCQFSTILFSSTTNVSSPVYQWLLNNIPISGATSATYLANSSILGSTVNVTCRVSSSLPCYSPLADTSNVLNIAVTPSVTPSVSISTPSSTICAGQTITFTATVTNGGASPTYVWKRNGVIQSSTTNTYSSSGLANGAVIVCESTSNAPCASPTTVTSNSITVTVNNPVSPSVNLTATQTTICSGNSVTFTATPTNGGSAPLYLWRKNGAAINGVTGNTYTTSALVNGDVFDCILTSNATCINTNSAASNLVTLTVGNSVVPSVIIQSNDTTICDGTSVTFTASPSNGGSSPIYQWLKNGSVISGATSAVYVAGALDLNNNDVITCVLTSSVSCASPTSATSSPITIEIIPLFQPSIYISPLASDTTCELSSITYLANANGAVSNYQWTVNGAIAPLGNSISFSPINPNDKDTVRCIATFSEACVTTPQLTSNARIITVTPAIIPSVSVATNQSSTCAGSSVTFTATPTNGGNMPAFKWFLNGVQISGASSSIFTTASINSSSDAVTCELTSSENCVATNIAVSNPISVNIVSSLTASVTVSALQTSLCAGEPFTFSAIGVNGGSAATYVWKINGVAVGSGSISPQFSSSNLNNGDEVSCEMTASENCVTQATVLSNSITITVNPLPTTTVNASGNTLTVDAADSYQWYNCAVNAPIAGENSQSYTAIANGDYKVVVGNASGCFDTSVCVNVNSVSVKKTESDYAFVQPNPFTESVTLYLNKNAEQLEIQILSADGRLVYSEISEQQAQTIHLPFLSSGMYILLIKTPNAIYQQKLIKE